MSEKDNKDGKEKTQASTDTTTQDDKKGDERTKTQKQVIDVKVDTGNIEDLIKRLKAKEDESADLQKKLNEEMEAKKLVDKSLEEKTSEAEDFESKLKLIAEEKLNAKRKVIMEDAKKYIKDPERLKKIEEKMVSPEDVQATEFMIETLATAFTEGEKTHKTLTEDEQKKAEEEAKLAAEKLEAEKKAKKEADPKGAAGQATLEQATGENTGQGYDSHEAMIRDLRKRSHRDDPQVAAEAHAILDELFLKWGEAVRKDYEGKYVPIVVEKKDQAKVSSMAKEGGAAQPNPKANKKRMSD